MRAYLGVDFGTSVLKGCVIDQDGRSVAARTIPRNQQHDATEKTPFAEHVWMHDFFRILGELSKCLDPLVQISGICVSGMVPNVQPLDDDGNCIGEPMLYFDNRAADIEQSLQSDLQTGKWQTEYVSKLVWLARRDAGTPPSSLRVLGTHAMAFLLMTGEYVCDAVTAVEMGILYDRSAHQWREDLIRSLCEGRFRMPKVVPATFTKPISDAFRDRCGLRLSADAVAVAGCSDSVASAISSGALRTGEVHIYFGTYICSAEIADDIVRVCNGFPSEDPLRWITSVPRGGRQISDVAAMLSPAADIGASLKQFDLLASQSKPGAQGVLFLPTRDFWNSTIWTEPSGCFRNITPQVRRADLPRAALESFGYIVRLSHERFSATLDRKTVFMGGGGANSSVWRQIVSDICGVSAVHLRNREKGVGTADLARHACIGSELGTHDLSSREIVSPDDRNAAAYRNAIEAYSRALSEY